MHYDDDVGQYCVHRQYLPDAVLALSSAATLIVALLVLNSYFCCTPATTHYQIRQQASKYERLLVLIHYTVALPLFELVVVWGSRYAQLPPNGASVVVSWIFVQLCMMLLLSISFWTARVHAFALHMSQVLQAPMMLFFLCDRALYHELGLEGTFCALVLVFAVAEALLRAQPVAQFGEARLITYPGSSQYIDHLLDGGADDDDHRDVRLDDFRTHYVAPSRLPSSIGRLRANTALHGRRNSAKFESPRQYGAGDDDDDMESDVGSGLANELKTSAGNRQDLQFLNSVAQLDSDLPPNELRSVVRALQAQAQVHYAQTMQRAAVPPQPGRVTMYLQNSNSVSFVAPSVDSDEEDGARREPVPLDEASF